MDKIIRKHYILHGEVQGVGFRYRAYHAAYANGVSGWVRNNHYFKQITAFLTYEIQKHI